MAEEQEPIRLHIEYEDVPVSDVRKILEHFEKAYNQVVLAQGPTGRRRVRRQEQLCIRQITAPSSVTIFLIGVSLLSLVKGMDLLKKYWDASKARWEAEKAHWDARTARENFKNAKWNVRMAKQRYLKLTSEKEGTEAIIRNGDVTAERFVHEAFQLISRLERSKRIQRVEIRFDDTSIRLK